ncbi:MAG TPA: ABC transporter permease [Blastocatellia bacterium]|nr:ABC transporter permease [Blastocatellia bacterium]
MIHYFRALAARLRGLFGKRGAQSELDEEIELHLRLLTERYVRQGMTEEEAARAARRQFGNVTLLQEVNHEMRGFRFIDTFFHDLKFGVRMIGKNPGFSFVVVITLALAIGVNTAIFTIVNPFLYRGLPFRGHDRIAYVAVVDTRGHGDEPLDAFSYPDYLDFKERLKSFKHLAAYQYGGVDLSDDGGFAEHYFVARMTANALSVLDQKPMLGRGLEPADTQPGAPPVVILTYRVWESRYHKNESVIGKTVFIDETPATIIGVTAADARIANDIALWLPLIRPTAQSTRENHDLLVFGRLADGVSISQASAEASAVARQMEVENPSTNRNIGAEVQDFNKFHLRAQIRLVMQALLGGVTFVLLIACANAANLLLGRAMIRSREMSIRAALGAGRLRVMRQLLTESVLLSFMAGALGTFLAYCGVKGIDALLASMETSRPDFTVDRNVLLYLAAITIGTGIVFGLAPAIRMSRVDLSSALKEGGHGAGLGVRRRLLTNTMVGAEVALSVVLLMGAGLMIRSMLNAGKLNLGVNTRNVMTMAINLPRAKYQQPQRRITFFQDLISRIEALPGVESATLLSELPGNEPFRGGTNTFQIEGSPVNDKNMRPRTALLTISPGYFHCLQGRLLMGREFTELDGAPGAEAAIINKSFADKHWPGENPLGKRIRVDDQETDAWLTIVGVAADIVQNRYREGLPQAYLPFRQKPELFMSVAARTRVDPESLAPAFRQSVKDLNANLPVYALRSLDRHVSLTNADTRVFGVVFTILGIIALALASTGLYAVISQSVSQRTREMAIRSAMGASGSQLWRLMFYQGMRHYTIGLAIGSALSLALGGVLNSLLVGVSSRDPITYLLVISMLTIVAALACGLPARRAARSDPATLLRFE